MLDQARKVRQALPLLSVHVDVLKPAGIMVTVKWTTALS